MFSNSLCPSQGLCCCSLSCLFYFFSFFNLERKAFSQFTHKNCFRAVLHSSLTQQLLTFIFTLAHLVTSWKYLLHVYCRGHQISFNSSPFFPLGSDRNLYACHENVKACRAQVVSYAMWNRMYVVFRYSSSDNNIPLHWSQAVYVCSVVGDNGGCLYASPPLSKTQWGHYTVSPTSKSSKHTMCYGAWDI